MSHINDKSDELNDESNVITKEVLETAIRSKEGRDNITVKQFNVTAGGLKSDNYASLTFAVAVHTEDNGADKIHNLFIKTLHSGEYLKQFSIDGKIFHKEGMAYSQIIPDMIQHQTDLGIEPVRPSMPTFYHSIVEDDAGIIIMEDMRPLGYALCNGRKGLDNEHCKLVVKKLANFHALSFAIKNGNPENLRKYRYMFHESIFTSPLPPHLLCLWKAALQLAKACANNDETNAYVQRLQNVDLEKSLKNLTKPVEPYSVICHGDLWCNNLLFKYEAGDKAKPTDVKLLDLQFVRYCLPTTDLAYFFFTSLTRDIRRKYMNDLLRLYYTTFAECLERLNLNFPEFTFDVFEELFAQSALYGVLYGCMLVSFQLAKPEIAQSAHNVTAENMREFQETAIKQLMEIKENIPLIEDWIIGCIADAVEMGIL